MNLTDLATIPPRIVRCEWCLKDPRDLQDMCHFCQGTKRCPMPLSELLDTPGTWRESLYFFRDNELRVGR